MKLARRLAGIAASPTIAVMEEAQRLRAEGVDIIDLGPGEPDFPTPDPASQAGLEAIQDGFTKYTASAGILELRAAIAERFNQKWGTHYTVANVIVTAGAKSAIYDVCTAVFEDGDEALIPAPYWVTFPEVVKIAGATASIFETAEESGFVLDPEAVEANISPNTRGLIVNTPNNPTGAVIPASVMREIVEVARERELFLLFDETYEYFTYEDSVHTSLAAFTRPEDEDYAITGSFSKTYAMTGWRVGYCVGGEALIRKLSQFQSHQSGNPSSISQKAALGALSGAGEQLRAMRTEYARRRAYVLETLDRLPGFRCPRPYGAFYAFPNVEEAMAKTGCQDSQEFARFLIREARVATVPGSAFGSEGYLRFSYATSMENLQEAFRRIKKAMG